MLSWTVLTRHAFGSVHAKAAAIVLRERRELLEARPGPRLSDWPASHRLQGVSGAPGPGSGHPWATRGIDRSAGIDGYQRERYYAVAASELELLA